MIRDVTAIKVTAAGQCPYARACQAKEGTEEGRYHEKAKTNHFAAHILVMDMAM